ncbi:hypothetical protein [Caenibacillus caldisaponilyticus]|uniref:hypothetical protein n=1 Tax=Caenibacillus caldisaponilyticus TaxID=1674942 RepID=UPI0009883D7E|nr:hypothetical protein [Caenibacillus caldisaponilyticus]
MSKTYGISEVELARILDQHVLKQGDTMDVERLREGLSELIRKNNEALMEDIKKLIENARS